MYGQHCTHYLLLLYFAFLLLSRDKTFSAFTLYLLPPSPPPSPPPSSVYIFPPYYLNFSYSLCLLLIYFNSHPKAIAKGVSIHRVRNGYVCVLGQVEKMLTTPIPSILFFFEEGEVLNKPFIWE